MPEKARESIRGKAVRPRTNPAVYKCNYNFDGFGWMLIQSSNQQYTSIIQIEQGTNVNICVVYNCNLHARTVEFCGGKMWRSAVHRVTGCYGKQCCL